MFNIGEVFRDNEQYAEKADWCNESGQYHIEEIEADEVGRRFVIVENPKPTEEQILEEMRFRREVECFAVINRGKLWYDTLLDWQIEELNQWYLAWLDAPQTKIIPEKPTWLN